MDSADRCEAADADLHLMGLSPREQEVLRLLSAGKTNPEIAAILFVSRRTARGLVSTVLVKLGVHHRGEAAAFARAAGIA